MSAWSIFTKYQDSRRAIQQISIAVEELRLTSVHPTPNEADENADDSQPAEESTNYSVDLEEPVGQKVLTLASSTKLPSTEKNSLPLSYISVSTSRPPSCQAWCSCRGHSQTYLNTPSIFNQVFGQLLLGYSGSPLKKSECTVRSCAAYSSRPHARATYFFPSWFFSSAIEAAFYRGPFGNISANIQTRGIQGRNSPVFEAVAAGNIVILQKL